MADNNDLPKTSEELIEAAKKHATAQKDIAIALGDQQRVLEINKNLQQKIAEILASKGEDLSDQYQQTLKTLRILEDELETRKKIESAVQASGDALDNSFQTLLGISESWKQTAIGSLAYAKSLGAGNEALDEMRDRLDQIGENAMPSMLQKVAEATLMLAATQSEARAEFVSLTGQTDEHVAGIIQLSRQYRFLGISAQEAARIAAHFSERMAGFNDVTESQRMELIATVGIMEQFGVSAQTMAFLAADMSKMFDMSTEQIRKQALELHSLAGPGLTAIEIFEGLSQAMPQLVQHGEKVFDVYKKLAMQSRVLHLETGALIDIAKQYDTFEGAAESVGKLNALLGGDYLNSVEMLNATEGERIEMLMQSMDLSNRNWETMGRYEKMAIANAAGISDMAEAHKIFNQSLDEYQTKQAEILANKTTQEQMEETAKKAQSLADDLISIAETFAVSMEPMITGLKWLTSHYADFDRFLKEHTNSWVGAGSAIVLVAGILRFKFVKSLILATANLATLGVQSLVTASQQTTQAAASQAQAASAAAAAKKMTGMGAAMAGAGAAALGMGVGFYAAANGVETLAGAMKGLTDDDFIKTVVMTTLLVAGGILAIAAASTAAAKPTLAVGAAALMFGGAILMASEGVAALAESMQALPSEMIDSLGNLLLKMAILGPMAPLLGMSALGIFAVATSFVALGKALETIDFSPLQYMGTILENINKLSAESISNFKKVGDEITRIMKSSAEAASMGADTTLKSVSEIVQSVTANAAPAAAGVGGGGAGGPIVVQLKLDRRTLEEVVVDIINKKGSVRNNP